MTEKVIGFDIGGTNVRVGLIDENLQLLSKKITDTASFQTKDELFTSIKDTIRVLDPSEEVKKMGVVLPVPIRPGIEMLSDATNVPYLESVQISEIHEFFKEYEVFIENDVNAVAVLEANIGSAKEHQFSLYITVSTGIGSGIIINRELFHGTHGYGGEVGSIQLSDSKGGFSNGTLENLCSGTALEQRSKSLFGDNATASTLFEKYQEGDVGAIQAIGEWIEYFSSGMASLIHCFDPGIIVLGGAVIQHNQWIVEKILEKTKKKVFANLVNKVKMVVSEFGNDAGLIGAGYMALKK